MEPVSLIIGALVIGGFLTAGAHGVVDTAAAARAASSGNWGAYGDLQDRRWSRKFAQAFQGRQRGRHRQAGGTDEDWRPGARSYAADLYHGFWERRLEVARAKRDAKGPYVHDPDRPSTRTRMAAAIADKVGRLRARRAGAAGSGRGSADPVQPGGPDLDVDTPEPAEPQPEPEFGPEPQPEPEPEPEQTARGPEPDPQPEQRHCPSCGEDINQEPPRYWQPRDWGPPPSSSHPQREPTCGATGQPWPPPSADTPQSDNTTICDGCGHAADVLYSNNNGGWDCYDCLTAGQPDTNQGAPMPPALPAAATPDAEEITTNAGLRRTFQANADDGHALLDLVARMEAARSQIAAASKELDGYVAATKFDKAATAVTVDISDLVKGSRLDAWADLVDRVIETSARGLSSLEKYLDTEAEVKSADIDAATLAPSAA